MTASRRPLHFIVEVHGKMADGKPTRATISHHGQLQPAFGAVVRILQQWEASHGATPTGTKALIKDARDGGTVFFMEYLGLALDLTSGR